MHYILAVQFSCLVTYFVTSCVTASPAHYCHETLMKGGASDRFPGLVAHGIHSLTVGDLQLFFKADVTSKNIIPTINADLRDRQAILFNAPDIPVNSMFATPGMRILDRVLSHMDNPDYDIREYNALERIIHAMHMQEVWHGASIEYAKLAKTPPSKELCLCVTDVDNNGVMEVLRLMALEVREPNLMYGKSIKLNNGTMLWDNIHYSFSSRINRKADEPLRKSSEAMTHVTNEKSWKAMKTEIMSGMLPTDDYELALYIYCALNA